MPAKNISSDPGYNLYKELISRNIDNHKRLSSSSWFVFVYTYIHVTKVLFEKIENSQENEKAELIVIPALYIFKHTLELLLKYISISIDQKFDNKHDLTTLVASIDARAVGKLIKKNSSKIKHVPSNSQVVEICKELSQLCDEYFYHTNYVSDMRAGDFIITDPENEIFKYPSTNKATVQIDPIFATKLTEGKRDRLIADLKKLRQCFNFFVNLIEHN